MTILGGWIRSLWFGQVDPFPSFSISISGFPHFLQLAQRRIERSSERERVPLLGTSRGEASSRAMVTNTTTTYVEIPKRKMVSALFLEKVPNNEKRGGEEVHIPCKCLSSGVLLKDSSRIIVICIPVKVY